MTQECIEKLAREVKNYYRGDGDKYIEKALISLTKSENRNAILRAKTEHAEVIDEGRLFDGGIDKSIAYLNYLKGEGYTHIKERWCGYEDNFFVATKIEDETDEEYYRRLADAITHHVEQFLKKENEENAKKKRIKELENELRQLKRK